MSAIAYRLADLEDVPRMLVLYRAMLHEHAARPCIHYPRWDATTADEMGAHIASQLRNPLWLGMVAVSESHEGRGGTVEAMILATIYQRPIGQPKHVGHVDLLYVHPAYRQARGRATVAVRLMQALGVEATRRVPDLVIEGSYVPGTPGARLWPRLGLTPYVVMCAYIHPDGTPRAATELFAPRWREAS